MAYHFGNRRLTFLKHPLLVEVVTRLGEHPSARAALIEAGVPETDYPTYLRALEGLVAADMLQLRAPEIAGAVR
ncbi:mycofactocin biosynthesis chaperone MftB [Nocardioides alcanivorans]|uniref:mycofactocin biosynthesis chaperone MftB n=1 Tax=Nocardioides alcanivorans TaxID=2897352 RepID=UPI001EEB8055|nr:mycofactocin biosynthesis chaperone MftB [Nocardioides alcanivorans]